MVVENLEELGVKTMDDGEIRQFLDSREVGVLGLSTESAPYLIPLSFGYDGESSLYFTYVTGNESRKQALTEAGSTARFLVFKVDSQFSWESVLASGTLAEVPAEEWTTIEDVLRQTWHPQVIDQALSTSAIRVFRFDIDDWTGIKHIGLPPGFEPRHRDESAE